MVPVFDIHDFTNDYTNDFLRIFFRGFKAFKAMHASRQHKHTHFHTPQVVCVSVCLIQTFPTFAHTFLPFALEDILLSPFPPASHHHPFSDLSDPIMLIFPSGNVPLMLFCLSFVVWRAALISKTVKGYCSSPPQPQHHVLIFQYQPWFNPHILSEGKEMTCSLTKTMRFFSSVSAKELSIILDSMHKMNEVKESCLANIVCLVQLKRSKE